MTFINGVLENTFVPTVEEVYRAPQVNVGLQDTK